MGFFMKILFPELNLSTIQILSQWYKTQSNNKHIFDF